MFQGQKDPTHENQSQCSRSSNTMLKRTLGALPFSATRFVHRIPIAEPVLGWSLASFAHRSCIRSISLSFRFISFWAVWRANTSADWARWRLKAVCFCVAWSSTKAEVVVLTNERREPQEARSQDTCNLGDILTAQRRLTRV